VSERGSEGILRRRETVRAYVPQSKRAMDLTYVLDGNLLRCIVKDAGTWRVATQSDLDRRDILFGWDLIRMDSDPATEPVTPPQRGTRPSE
jgi:hypothetical protein